MLTEASWEPDLSDHVGNVKLPSLVVSGDHDWSVPLGSSVRLAEALPGARLVVIPDCGHVPQQECPEPFLGAVGAFLGELAGQ
jgi:pimeloyl-ACP methyl ester carboxylesterase